MWRCDKTLPQVSNDRITDAKFQCFGCVGSVACGSVLTEIILGKEVKAAETVGETDILDALGGLSEEKGHCATLAIGRCDRRLKVIVR